MRTVLMLALVGLTLGCVDLDRSDVRKVSLAALLCDPEEFLGATIRTSGFLLESEGMILLFLTREHGQISDVTSAIRVGGVAQMDAVHKHCNGVYATIVGVLTFDGFMSVHPVSRILAYPTGRLPSVSCWPREDAV